jgi:hypothetical protein
MPANPGRFYHGWPREAKPQPKTSTTDFPARQSRNPNNSTTDFTDFTDKKIPFPIREIREIRGKIFAKESEEFTVEGGRNRNGGQKDILNRREQRNTFVVHPRNQCCATETGEERPITAA